MRPRHIGSIVLVSISIAVTAAAQTPARPGEAPRSDPSRSVTLSLTEYNRLLDLAGRPASAQTLAPIAAVIATAEARVRVDGAAVSGVFSLAGEVLRPGINRVNLISGATVTDASVDGRPLPLIADGGGHWALLPGPGPFTVALNWGMPLSFAPGRASFTLPALAAGASRATIDLPGEQADVRLSSGVITRRSAAGGRTLVDVTLRPGTPSEIAWSMRDSAPVAAGRDLRILADVYTLVTVGDADVRMAALVDATVVQGEPRTIAMRLPAGYELSGVTGASLAASEPRDGSIVLTVIEPAARRLQFLVTLERAHQGGSFQAATDFIALPDVQRERGEIAIEGAGTLDLDVAERSGMHRIDVRELNPSLQSLARFPLLAAFRYQRLPTSSIELAMKVQRFPDADVLAAVADRAMATTLITGEGRALTEVSLWVRNRAQPFLKVTLPAGATIVSVEVAGESAKPVVGADGTRVPLLRPGFRPSGRYVVSYVYMHAGTPFAKKGDLAIALPRMDIPVGVVEWEMFVPDRYSVKPVDGNVIERVAFGRKSEVGFVHGGVAGGVGGGIVGGVADGNGGGIAGGRLSFAPGLLPGQVLAKVTDSTGAGLPGTTVAMRTGRATLAGVTSPDGTVTISGVPTGDVTATAELAGFRSQTVQFAYDQRQPRRITFQLSVSAIGETVTVAAATPREDRKAAEPMQLVAPSANVLNLQKRAAGVLPIPIDVPRAGTAHQFIKPLVVDQEATVTLRYKRR